MKQMQTYGKLLPILRWTTILFMLATFFATENTKEVFPTVYTVAKVIADICKLLYGVGLLKLAVLSNKFRISGWLSIAAFSIGMAASLFISSKDVPILIQNLPAPIMVVMSEYYECKAHADVLKEIKEDLSKKWSSFWWRYLIVLIVVAISFALIRTVPAVGVSLILAVAIVTILIELQKINYLKQTATMIQTE